MPTLASSNSILDVKLSRTERTQPLSATPVQIGCKSREERWRVEPDQKHYTTNNFLNKLQDVVIDGRPLPEKFLWRGTSLWQFLPSFIWPVVARSVGLTDALKEIVSDDRPRLLRYAPVRDHTESIWQEVVESVAQAYGIPAECTGTLETTHKRHPRAFFWARIAPLVTAHKVLGLGSAQPSQMENGRLLFCSVARNWKTGADGKKRDEQCEPIVDALRIAGWTSFVGVDCPYNPRHQGLAQLINRRREAPEDTDWCGFYAYSSMLQLRREFNESQEHFRALWENLQHNQDFLEQFRHEGIPLLPALREELSRAFITTLPHCAAMLVAAGNVLETTKPDALAATYETGPFQRAMIIEAMRRTIPSVGLMHGLIIDSHYDYTHHNVAPSVDPDRATFTVPDVTCVWGDAAKKTLTDVGHYPTDSVAVTGNWRYDHIQDRSELAPPCDVKGRPRRILIVSGGQQVAHFVELCLANLPDNCKPVVRLHPFDDPRPVIDLLKKLGQVDILRPDGALSDHLAESDVVVSQWSTSITEAILMGKPTVFADYHSLGHGDYFDFGAFLHAMTPDQMREKAEAALSDPKTRSHLSGNRSRFIHELFDRLDGRSADRVARILIRLVDNRRTSELAET